MELINGCVRVIFEDIGEGFFGDYDSDDGDDIPLLRFFVDIMKDGTWEGVESASYCTMLPTYASPEIIEKGLQIIMDNVYAPLMNEDSIKHICAELSWMDEDYIINKSKGEQYDKRLCFMY